MGFSVTNIVSGNDHVKGVETNRISYLLRHTAHGHGYKRCLDLFFTKQQKKLSCSWAPIYLLLELGGYIIG